MLRAELKKCLSFRVLWILLFCLLCINGYSQITNAYDRYYTPSEYNALYEQLNRMSLQEANAFVSAKIESASPDSDADYNGYLYYDTLEIIEGLQNYPAYLESIQTNAENMTAVSIWGGTDTFSYRNIQKTPSAYTALAGTTLVLDTSLGIEDLLSNPLTDFLAVLLLFFCVCRIFLRDREQGILPLLYATPNGRLRLMSCKLGIAVLCAIGLVLLFYGEIALISCNLYGLGDLSRPIQCIYGYETCNLPVSVGTYISIYLLFKMAAYAVFAVLFGFFCTIAKNNLMVYGASIGVVGISYLLYAKISVLSPISLLHFWNPIQFLQGKEILGTYTNVNCFGYPISLKISACVVIGLWLFLFIGSSFIVFTHAGNLQYRSFSVRHKLHIRFRVHQKFWYTCYRILILQKGLLVVFLLLFLSVGLAKTYTRTYSNEDIYYENFCNEYAGVVTEKTEQFLTEKRAFYREIEAQIAELEQSESPNSYQIGQLTAQLNDKAAFEKFAQRVEQIPDSAEIFYDTGYVRYFALDGNWEGMVQVLLLTAALTLLLCPTTSMDCKTNLKQIYHATKIGRLGYLRQMFRFAILNGILFSAVLILPYLLQILNHYGMQGWNTPLAGIEAYSTCPARISVGAAAIGVMGIRTIGAALTGCSITWIASHCKSLVTAYCINGVLFVLPAGLCLLGLDMFRYVGLTPMLYGII